MAVDMFLKIDGIPGDSTDNKHKDEIEVLSFSWGVRQTGASSGGGGGGSGKAEVSDFSFIKRVGAASPALFVAVCKGDHFDEAIFTASSGAASGKKATFYKVTFSDVLISSVSPAGQGNDLPMESVSLNFAKVEIEYQDAKGGTKEVSCDFIKES
jgi:type VI secretion system secreted protein Hcp